jgi:hypothetical protein
MKPLRLREVADPLSKSGHRGRVSCTNRRKVLFSGAARHADEAARAGYFAALSGESAETGLGGGAE